MHAELPSRSTVGSEFLGDRPAAEGLGMGKTVDTILDHLLQRPKVDGGGLPTTHTLVGVFGHWGSGKTHVLNLLGQKLVARSTPTDRYLACCFRAWEYEAETDLASAFIRCLVNEQSYPWAQCPPSFDRVLPSGATLRQAAWKFADFVFKLGKSSAVPGLGIVSEIGQALLDLRETGKPFPPEPVTDQVRRAMQELVKKLSPDGTRLFVLVDDLDRCSPPNIVKLFEWLKNHLDTTPCTYVLGLDHRIAAKAIVGHYKDYIALTHQEALDYGFRYLDKLFEIDFEILPNPLTEQMVLARLQMRADSLCAWTREAVGRDFGGEPEMSRLLRVSALWVPRILLRTVVTFRMSLGALLKQNTIDGSLLSNDLPSSFPFWLFLLSALHHLFPPNHVEAFARSDLKQQQSKTGIGSILSEGAAYGPTDPRCDFIGVLNEIKVEPLSMRQTRYLYQAVREKTPRSFRSPGIQP